MTDERPTAQSTPTAASDDQAADGTAALAADAAHDAATDGRPRYFDLYREPVGITPLTDGERAVLRMVNQRVSALPTLDDVIDLLLLDR